MKITRKNNGKYNLKLDKRELEKLYEYFNNTEVDSNNSLLDDEERHELAELNQFGWDAWRLLLPEIGR